jgi:probable F420-dependent oxidoreductase
MYRPFRFAVVTGSAESQEAWVTKARKAEDAGYSALLVADHLSTGIAPLTSLAVAAQATTSLRVGSFVFGNGYRHPVLLAKEIATLDLLSQGRFELGIGAGNWPSDFEQMGIPFESVGVRISRLIEALHIMKKVFTEEVADFQGKYYTITHMQITPKPIQRPYPPIHIASSGQRMLTVAAQEADIINITPRGTLNGVDPEDATPEAVKRKIQWIREAAGERFSQIEFGNSAFHILISDGKVTSGGGQLRGPETKRVTMSVEQAVDHLLEQREIFGFSYIQVLDSQLEAFMPVVARLAGK